MTEVQAHQHIFANVEKEQSPAGRGGFQTLFYTHAGLTEADIEESEARLLYYPSEVEPVKWVYDRLATGRVLVAQIVPLPEPDSAGRGGRYLAHALLLSPEDFDRLGADPLAILVQFSFFTTVEAVLAQGEMATGEIPPATVAVTPMPAPDLEGAWSREAFRRLVWLGLRAESLARESKSLLLTGSEAEVRRALGGALLAVPTSMRRHCTFDTYFHRCNPVATYYWAIGLPEARPNPNHLHVDCAAGTVDDAGALEPATCYERWVLALLGKGQLTARAGWRDQADLLCRWLDGGEVEPEALPRVPDDVVASVFQACEAQVQAMLRRQIAAVLPPVLVERVFPILYGKGQPAELFARLLTPMEAPALLDLLHRQYAADDYACPPSSELAALRNVLESSPNLALQLWAAYWSEETDELKGLLSRLSVDDYRRFLARALRVEGDRLALLAPEWGEAYLEACQVAGVLEELDLPTLVSALADGREPAATLRLIPLLATCDPRTLKALQKLAKTRSDLPVEFTGGVSAALDALPKRPGVVGLIKGLFTRK